MADGIDQVDDLAVPVQTTLTADKQQIKSMTIDAVNRRLIVCYSKGAVDGGGTFTEVFSASAIVENTEAVLDDDDQVVTPADPAFNDLMQNTQLAVAIRNAAQPWTVGRVLRALANGVI